MKASCGIWTLADALHALLAFLLLLEDLHFSGDVAAVELGGDILAVGLDRLAGDDLAADGDLQRDLELVARDGPTELDDELSAASLGVAAVDDQRESLDRACG